MGITDLIERLLPDSYEKLGKSFEEARAQIDKVLREAEGLRDTANTEKIAECGEKLLKLINEFSWPAFTQLQVDVPFGSRSAIKLLTQNLSSRLRILSESTAALKYSSESLPLVREVVAKLNVSRTELDYLHSQSILSIITSRRWRAAIVSLITLAGVTAIFARLFLGLQSGLENLPAEVVFPEGPYAEIVSNQFQLNTAPADRQAFMEDFAQYYFRKKDLFGFRLIRKYAFDDQSVEKALELEVGQRWKFLSRNRSFYSSEFISSIEVRLKAIQLKEFPWNELPVKPVLVASEYGNNSSLLHIDGYGPALDFAWKIASVDGLPIGKGKQWILSEDSILNIVDQCNIAGVLIPRTRKLDYPELYLKLASQPDDAIKTDRHFEHLGNWYELVNTIERLKEITRVSDSKEAVLTMEYSSLGGEKQSLKASVQLEKGVLFFEKTDSLLERDPREMVERSYTVQVPYTQQMSALASVLVAIKDPPVQPEGVDLLVSQSDFYAHDIEVGQEVSIKKIADRYLNPRGHICLYVNLISPRTGVYAVTTLINGNQVSASRVNCFYPETPQFPLQMKDRWAEVCRLRKSFGIAQPLAAEMPQEIHLPLATPQSNSEFDAPVPSRVRMPAP